MNRLFVLLGFALLVAQTAVGQNYTVVDLGVLPGGTYSVGQGINQSGQVAGSANPGGSVGGNPHAFLFNGTTMSDLGTLGGTYSQGQGINQLGQVTGFADSPTSGGSPHAFLSTNGTMSDLGALPGGSFAAGYGINQSGQVTGYGDSGGRVHAFLYSKGTMSDLGALPGFTSSAGQAINQSGQVTGYSDSGSSANRHAFLFNGTTMSDLGTLLGGSTSQGQGINQSGQVAGFSDSSTSRGNPHAFLFNGTTMSDLGTLLGGAYSYGYGINNSGQVVGFADSPTNGGNAVAFLFSNGTMQNLNSLIPPNSGWVLLGATAINDSGQITGYGAINGATHAFLLNPVAPAVPFASFRPQAAIDLDANAFLVGGTFTLGTTSDGIAPLTEPVQLKLGTFSTTLPAGSFKKNGGGFMFSGTINGVKLDMLIQPTGKGKYFFAALARGANLAGTVNPVTVGLTIGNDTGSVSITVFFE